MPGAFGLKDIIITVTAQIQFVVTILDHFVTDLRDGFSVPDIMDGRLRDIPHHHFEIEIEATYGDLSVMGDNEFLPRVFAWKRKPAGRTRG